MSIIGRLFPAEELRKWDLVGDMSGPEPASKRRKLSSPDVSYSYPGPRNDFQKQDQPQRQLRPDDQRPHLWSSSGQQSKGFATPAAAPRQTSYLTPKKPVAGISLPSFIEPTILEKFLCHLHPSDRPRYALGSSTPWRREQYDADGQIAETTESEHDSPPSLSSDSSASPEPFQDPETPPPTRTVAAASASAAKPRRSFDEFRSGPFGYIFDAFRLTSSERDLLETVISEAVTGPGTVSRKPGPSLSSIDFTTDDFYDAQEANFLCTSDFPFRAAGTNTTPTVRQHLDQEAFGLDGIAVAAPNNLDAGTAQNEGENETETKSETQTAQTLDSIAISMDDFFDLDEASEENVPCLGYAPLFASKPQVKPEP